MRGGLITRSTPQEAAAASDPAVLIREFLLWHLSVETVDYWKLRFSVHFLKMPSCFLSREGCYVFLICFESLFQITLTFFSLWLTSGWCMSLFTSLLRLLSFCTHVTSFMKLKQFLHMTTFAQKRYFKPKVDLYLNLNKCVLCINRTRPQPQKCKELM